MAFIEERLNEQFGFGSDVVELYDVIITQTSGGNEYRALRHPYPILEINLDFQNRTESYIYTYLKDFYRRSGGKFGGFRWKNPVDYSTNNRTGTPAYNDELCVLVSTNIYQITNWYGTEGGSTATRRRIKKPVTGTTLVGINNPTTGNVQSVNGWTVDTTTGKITFANNQKSISNITQAAAAVITVGSSHGYVTNDSVYISGVGGMTQINGRRALITGTGATTITVAINSSAFTAFSATSPSGLVNTVPQSGETVRAGCQFDIPVRFDNDFAEQFVNKNSSDNIMGANIRLVEILNP